MNILYAMLSTLLVSLLSLIGLSLFCIKKDLLKKVISILVAFAVWAMLWDAFLHLIPHVYENGNSEFSALLILCWLFMFFILEKFLRWRHCHHMPDECDHKHPVAIINLVWDGLHNFIDGILIVSSYIISIPLWITTTIAVAMHEIPQEIGDYATLIHAWYSRKKAVIMNMLISLFAFLWVLIILVIDIEVESIKKIMLPITAWNFIYIACADLIPMLHKKNKLLISVLQFIWIILGVGIMYVLLSLH